MLANGGTKVSEDAGEANSVKTAEIWNPSTGTWRTAATAQRTRSYHSTSLLLPSGAVFTGGGGVPGPEDNFNAELYYPAYLFAKGTDGVVRWASRPAITAIAGNAVLGGSVALTIGDGRAIASASLISSPTVTHSENTDQRRIPLQISQSGGTVTATLPASADALPTGTYELSVVDAKGVPSASQMITIRRGAAATVTVAAPDGRTRAAATADASEPIAGAGPVVTTQPAAPPVAPAGSEAPTGTGTAIGGSTTAAPPAAPAPAPAPAPATGSTPVPAAPTAGSVPLKVDTSVGLQSTTSPGSRVSRSGSAVALKAVSAAGSAASAPRPPGPCARGSRPRRASRSRRSTGPGTTWSPRRRPAARSAC